MIARNITMLRAIMNDPEIICDWAASDSDGRPTEAHCRFEEQAAEYLVYGVDLAVERVSPRVRYKVRVQSCAEPVESPRGRSGLNCGLRSGEKRTVTARTE